MKTDTPQKADSREEGPAAGTTAATDPEGRRTESDANTPHLPLTPNPPQARQPGPALGPEQLRDRAAHRTHRVAYTRVRRQWVDQGGDVGAQGALRANFPGFPGYLQTSLSECADKVPKAVQTQPTS